MTEVTASLPKPSPQELEQEYLACLLRPDGREARRLIESALAAGISAATLYLEVITPAMREIGSLWETARISVAQEHLSTQITQTVIAGLGLHLAGGEPVGLGRSAVVASSEGEIHALGTRMVADFLEAQGWTVLALGADIPAEEVAEVVRAREAELVALSTALPGHLLSVTRTCQLLRRLPRPPLVIVGGRAYDGDEARSRAVGADGFAEDPRALLELLALRFGGDGPH